MKRIFFFLIDGLADPASDFTPFKIAKKSNLSLLLSKSFLSYIYPLDKKQWPKIGERSVSGLANLSILGYKIKPELFKRGVYEAIGSGLYYKEGWLALRVNFCTIDENLIVLDRRAGRNIYGFKKIVSDINKIKLEIPFVFKHTTGHRGVLIFKKRLSDNIPENDPYEDNRKIKKIQPIKRNKISIYTINIIQNFLENVYKLLKDHQINKERKRNGIPPANFILIREAGNKTLKLKNFFKKYRFKNGVVIATNGVVKGTCISVGFKEYRLKEQMSIKNEMNSIKKAINENYKKYQLLYTHLKKADEASHDKNLEKKKKFFEEFDKLIGEVYKKFKKDLFVITGDHITDTKNGKHKFGPVPLLIINSRKNNDPKEFSEKEAINKGIIFKNKNKLWKFLEENVK